jgi:predicted NUDIX family NTP pyrophosphohydrolase
MPLHSAGLLLYRTNHDELELLLAHPGGPYWKDRDEGAWSIPKGLFDEDEVPLEAARREFKEETGFEVDGAFIALGELKQPGGKIVHAWALEKDVDADNIVSNTYAVEWPYKSGRWRRYPEVDRAGWFTVDEARKKILKGQVGFIDRLLEILGGDSKEDVPSGKDSPVQRSLF